jgi:hypothetical protein
MRSRYGVIGLLGVLVVPSLCNADDGAIHSVGGDIRLMQEHPTIEMTAEFVHAWVSRSEVRVECVFFLKNNGPETSVTVGFPNRSSGADVSSPTPFLNFTSYVDGESVDVVAVQDTAYSGYGDARSWLVKEVAFDSGQSRCLRETYSARPGTVVPDYNWFEYTLDTGSSWASSIGVGDIVITLDGISTNSLINIQPGASFHSSSEIRWHFADLEPTQDSGWKSIVVAWGD